MEKSLKFDFESYISKSSTINGKTIHYAAYEDICYCSNPVDPIQKMNIFVPMDYYEGKQRNGYSMTSAPIFMPNGVGGYMSGAPMEPGVNFDGEANSVFAALEHGYVVACAGIRGRDSGQSSKEYFIGGNLKDHGEYTGKSSGKAPAFVVDMKAAIRYLRYNKDTVPGDTEKIITNGTSAGGALSALTAASGNHPDFEPLLQEIGAAPAQDHVFAASCYCPIHNLENADAAYEWMFHDETEYYSLRFRKVNGKIEKALEHGSLTAVQKELSVQLKNLFPGYVNSLCLKDKQGKLLNLNADGTGSFAEYIKKHLIESAQQELNHPTRKQYQMIAVPDSDVKAQNYFTIQHGVITDLHWQKFVHAITRMKPVPAFDALDLSSPENNEFGTQQIAAKHFTHNSFQNSTVGGQLAEESVIKQMNPISYIGHANTAQHWRIRHGSHDRDTSLAIPVILATLLENRGFSVDFCLPWGIPHSGDYDLPQLFQWIDSICK